MQSLAKICLVTMIGVFLIWVAGFIGFNVHIKGLQTFVKDTNTDAVIVLTGGPHRINEGLDLLDQKRARYLFITGVNTQVSQQQLISMWREDVKEPPCCIILGHEARNTRENAMEAKDWIELNNIQSIRLLTTDYHMPRALIEFRQLLPNIDIVPHMVIPDHHNWPVTIAEYNKTIFTSLRTNIGGGHS